MNRKKAVIILLAVLSLVTLLQYLIKGYFNPDNYSAAVIIFSPLTAFITGIVLLFTLVIPFFDATSKHPIKRRILYLSLFAPVYAVIFILAKFIIPLGLIWPSWTSYESATINYAVSNFHNVLKNYIFQIAVLYAYEYVYRETRLITTKKDLEMELNQTKLQILKSQIQPHFLFNALNSIVAIVDENKQKAQEMLINLSDILRTTLQADFKSMSTLSTELEYLEKYLHIEKIRYEDQLQFHFDVPAEALSIKIPSLLLQPLVENAIKHGFIGMQRRLEIVIKVYPSEKTIQVINDGAPLKQTQDFTGLTNVKERLKIFYPDTSDFKIYQQGSYIINEIRLG